jgi:hypothetical protein
MKNKIFLGGVLISLLVIAGCSNGGSCVQGYGPVIEVVRDRVDFTAVSNSGSFEVRVTQADTFGVMVKAQENLHQMIEIYVSGSTLVVQPKSNTCINSVAPILVYVSLPYLEAISNTGSGRLSADRAESEEFECSNMGSGLISIDSVFAAAVSLYNSGSGELAVLASYPDEIEISQSGSGTIDAGFMISPLKVSINQTSSGEIYAIVLDGWEVNATLSGSGLVSLSGDAETASLGLSASGKIDAINMPVSSAEAMISGSGKIYVYAEDYLDVIISGSGDVYYLGNPQIKTRISGSGSVRPY